MKIKGMLIKYGSTFAIRQDMGNGEFKDLQISHDDLSIEIDDETADIVVHKDGIE